MPYLKKNELCKNLKWFYICFMVCNNFNEILCEEKHYALSNVRLAELLEKENFLLKATLKHITEQQEKLNKIESVIRDLQDKHDKIGSNTEEYISSPLHSFSLVRRMHADWPKWIDFIKKPPANDINSLLNEASITLPTTLDMAEAAEGLHRIQSYYQMNPIYLAEGIYEKEGSGSLTCLDLQQIGRELLKLSLSAHAALWFKAAKLKCLQRNKKEVELDHEIHGFSFLYLHTGYADALLRQNEVQKALDATKSAINSWPFDKRTWRKKAEIERILATSENFYYEPEPKNDLHLFAHYCQPNPLKKSNNLYCRLEVNSKAFYKLSPLRLEILNLDPYVTVYHDAMRESQMVDLKKKALADMQLHTYANALLTFNQTKKLYKHLSDLTGFNAEGFEELSLSNYGIGGHANLHYDFYVPEKCLHFELTKSDIFDAINFILTYFTPTKRMEKLMATAMLYLSDIEYGGSAIIPWHHLIFYPRKGSILLWHNVENNGNPERKSLHGACPVIFGSKWAGTIWIQYTQQMFTKPCLRK